MNDSMEFYPSGIGAGADFVKFREKETKNAAGCFQLIELETKKVGFQFPDREIINYNLRLIYGIGPATLLKLKNEGYDTLRDLLGHPRWSAAAAAVLKMIAAGKLERLADYGATGLELLGFFKPETVKFIDIETSGLYYIHPVFLIGILEFKNGKGYLRQLLARDYAEEKAILAELSEEFRNTKAIASYNGKSFDIPYLRGRFRFYRLDDDFNLFHLDLLGITRKNYRKILPDCRLATVEKYLLEEERTGDLPGSEAPEYYRRFLESGASRLLEPVLKHNAADLLALAKLLGVLTSGKQVEVSADGN